MAGARPPFAPPVRAPARMLILDFLLNAACLILWLGARDRPATGFPGGASAGPGRSVGRQRFRGRLFGVILLLVILLRAVLYWQLGPALGWTPGLGLGPVELHFRSDVFSRMLIYSVLGFLLVLASCCFSLLLLAAVHRRAPAGDPWMVRVRVQLGWMARLPVWLMLLAPGLVMFLCWLALGPCFGVLGLVAPPVSLSRLLLQAALIGVSAWLLWQYVIAAVLLLSLVSTYIFLGGGTFWTFIERTAQGLARPVGFLPLRVGRIDLAPVLVLAGVILIAWRGPDVLSHLYGRFAV